MADGTKLDTIYYELELRAVRFNQQLDGARQKLRTLDDAAPKPIVVHADTRAATENLERLRLGAVAASVGLLAIGAAAVRMADQTQLATDRLKLAVEGTDQLAVAQTRLAVIADDTFQSYASTVDLYARLATATKELDRTQDDLAQTTEATALAVRLSGASAEAANAGLIQFGQALSSGRLSGDELRSVLEQLPRLARAIAEGLGVSVGELRALGEQGTLTSEQILQALLKELPKLRDEAAQLAPTLGQAVTVFENAMARYVADTNQATGATGTLASAIALAANNFDAIVTVATIAGAIFAGRVVAPIVQATQALAAAQLAQVRASAESVTARATEAGAALQAAEAEQAITAARVRDLQATKAAIIAERELQTVRLRTANTRLETAVAAASNPTAFGMTATEAANAQAAAQARVSRTTAELVQLGQQQTRVQRELTAATTAAAAAQGVAATATRAHGAAIAGTTIAARAGVTAMAGFQATLAFFGGPIGLAITAAIVGIGLAMDRQRQKTADAREELARMAAQLEKMTEAQVRNQLGQLEGQRIGLLLQRQQLAPGDRQGQDALSVQEAQIGETMGRLRQRLAEFTTAAKQAADSAGSDMARAVALSGERLRIFNAQGERGLAVWDAAAARWKDSTTANRDFARALSEGDARAKALLASAEVIVANERAITEGRKGLTASTKAAARDAKELADAQANARTALEALSARLANRTPFEEHQRAIEAWRLEAQKAALPPAEIAAGLDRLDDALDQEAAQKLQDLATAFLELQAATTGDAIQALDVTFARQLAEIERRLAEAEALQAAAAARGDTAGARDAADVVAQLTRLRTLTISQRDTLREIEGLAARAATAREVEARFAQTADTNFKGQAVTLADLRRIENDRLNIAARLQEIINDPRTDPKARARAQEELNRLAKGETTQRQDGADALDAAGKTARALGDGLRQSAQAALSLVQVLGQGNTELSSMLAGVVSLGSGIADLGSAAGKAGGFGKLFTSSAGLSAALGPMAAIAGGAFAIFGAISKSSEEAKRRAEELKQAAETFTRNLGRFVQEIAEANDGEFTRARNALAERITGLLADAAKAAGFDPKSYDGTRQSAASLQGLLDSVEAQIAALQDVFEAQRAALQEQGVNADPGALSALTAQLGTLTKFANGLGQAIEEAEKAEAALSERQRQRLKLATEDLAVLRLEVTGQNDAAAAMRERLEAERNIQQALDDFSGAEGYEAYVAALREVTELQLKAAQATRKLSGALRLLDDLEAFFPELTGRDFSGLRATGARVWPEIFNTLFDGLDLSTRSGLQGAHDRIRNLYTALAKDGIDESERPLVDFLKRFFGEIGDAIDGLGDPILNAIEAFNVQAENAGFTAAQRFQGLGAFLKLNTAGLGDILGTSFQQDVLTGEGRASLEARIRQGISDIVADGQITDAERPLLDALQQLLGLVLEAIDDAAETASSARDRATQTRTTASQLDLALGDLEGADAFQNTLEKFTPAFAALFETFDLQALEGIEGARQGLRSIRADLDKLTDAELLAKYGMTREEIVAALLEVDAGLDGLASTLKTLAEQSVDFVTTLTNDWLDATGRGMDVQLAAVDQWVEDMLAEAERLGVITDAIRTMINEIADERRAEIRERFAPKAETPRDLADRTGTATSAASSDRSAVDRITVLDGETTAQRVSSISETSALSLQGVFTALLDEARGTRLAVEQMVGLLRAMGLGTLTAPEVPALPSRFASGGGGAQVYMPITIQVSSAIGIDAPKQVAEEMARALLPHIDYLIGKEQIIESRTRGWTPGRSSGI